MFTAHAKPCSTFSFLGPWLDLLQICFTLYTFFQIVIQAAFLQIDVANLFLGSIYMGPLLVGKLLTWVLSLETVIPDELI